jgi:hypothetical protein
LFEVEICEARGSGELLSGELLLFTNGRLVDRFSARLKEGSGVAGVERAVNGKFKRSKRKKGIED